MKSGLYSTSGRFEAVTWYGPFKDHPSECARALPELGISGSLVLEDATGIGGAHLPELGLHVAPILDPHPGLFFVRPHLAEMLPRFLRERNNPEHRIRVPCWNNPVERKASLKTIVEHAKAYQPDAVLWMSIANEGASTKQNAAFDFCACPFCIDAFKQWLTQRYGSLAGVNQAWQTDYEDWDTVRPATTDELKGDVEQRFSAWYDTRQFVDDGFYDALAEACAAVRAVRPGIPLSLNGLWPSGPFGAQNLERIGHLFDLIETNDECGDLELVRSFTETQSDLAFTFAIVKDHEARFWDHTFWMFFIHGARAVVVEKFRRLFNLDTDRGLTPGAKNLAAMLATVQRVLAPALAGYMRDDDPVLVLYSPRSQARAWAEKALVEGEEWACRPPAWQHNDEPYLAAHQSWYRLIEDAGRQFKVVSVQAGLDVLPGKGRLLVVPLPTLLSASERDWVQRFMETGGAVACCHPIDGIEGRGLRLPPETEAYRKTRLQSLIPAPELTAFRNFADSVLPSPLVCIESERNERIELTVFKRESHRILVLHRNDIRRFFDVETEPEIPDRTSLTLSFKAPFLIEDLLAPHQASRKACTRISVTLEQTKPVFLRLTHPNA